MVGPSELAVVLIVLLLLAGPTLLVLWSVLRRGRGRRPGGPPRTR